MTWQCNAEKTTLKPTMDFSCENETIRDILNILQANFLTAKNICFELKT